MRKILTSLSIIAFAAAMAISATVACFQDTETSSGNTFTAGTIDLTVDSLGSTYNNTLIYDSSFEAKDLTVEKFFNFGDVKPGDFGWRSLSLHVEDNSAWACLLIHNKKDDENTPVEPEIENGDDLLDGIPNGELSKGLELFAWEDLFANGKFDPVNELKLTPVPDSFFDIAYITYSDSIGGAPKLTGYGDMRNIGLFWCAGTLSVNPAGDKNLAPGLPGSTLLCDGAGLGNIAQTDIFTASISLYAEQWRNNPNFSCANVTPPTP